MTITVRLKQLWYKVLIAGCSAGLFILYKCRMIIVKMKDWCDGHQGD